ncbi:MAG TPA: efflux RND transporter periplasmic adaptor subunit [Xanthobacteraceae bacterium]|nr:efflux RND transporter periplasmic adaptor subunit [Xanthobacteraceae bacterium]
MAAGIALASLAAVIIFWRHTSSQAASTAAAPSVPVVVGEAAQRDVPIYYHALGTVYALNTVAIRAQVNGQIISIDFRQGQEVRRGDVLAKIDPAPFKAVLDQAISKKSEDEAQLIDAEKDLVRYKALVLKNFETQQNVDAQQAKVDQDKATIDADQAAIEAAQTQLDFATITAPIDGVVGFRQVDIGNIIHTNDVNPLTVLTQIRPCTAIFTLPQNDLGPVREAMLQGAVPVLAYDQDDKHKLAEGTLLLINNQIDQATSTIQLKAEFPNSDERLWPGEFVRIRLLITTRKDAITIPAVALQRGPDGYYVWVVAADDTAQQRPVDALIVSEDQVIASKGLNAGERVVIEGQTRLDNGTHVAIRAPNAPPAAAAPRPDKS